MDQEQLTLFDDDAVTGTGQPRPWPTAAVEPELEAPGEDPDQLAFDEPAAEAA